MANLIIEGNTYKGIFNGEKRVVDGEDEVTSEVGRHTEHYHKEWYEGCGKIQDKKTKKEYTFAFSMPSRLTKNSLEESIRSLAKDSDIDSIFGKIVTQVRDSNDEIANILIE